MANLFFYAMNRNKKIFLIIAILFTLGMIAAAIQMGMKTTPPWEKKKEIFNKYKVK